MAYQAVIPIILEWRERMAEVFAAVRERIAALGAMRYPGALVSLAALARRHEELNASIARVQVAQAKLKDLFDRGVITQERYEAASNILKTRQAALAEELKHTDFTFARLRSSILEAETGYERVGRTLTSATRVVIRFGWRIGIMGWILSYHIRRIQMMMGRWFSISRRILMRIIRFFWKCIRTVAEFPKAIVTVAKAMGFLEYAGLLTEYRLGLLLGLMYKLGEYGPVMAGLVGAVETAFIALAVAVAEGVTPHMSDLLDLIFAFIESPFIDWFRDLTDTLLTAVIPAMETFITWLGTVPEKLPPLERLGELFSTLAMKTVELSTTLLDLLLPHLNEIILAIISLIDECMRLAPELAPRLVEAFLAVVEAIRVTLPLLPELITAMARFAAIAAVVFATLSQMLGPELFSLVMVFNLLSPIVVAACSVLNLLGAIMMHWTAICAAATAATHAFAAAVTFLFTTPLGGLILAIGVIIAMIYVLVTKWDELSAVQKVAIGIIIAVAGAVALLCANLLFATTVFPLATAAASAFGTVLTFIAANPIVLIIAAIAALVLAILWLWQNWDSVSKQLKAAWDATIGAITGAIETAIGWINSFVETVTGMCDAVMGALDWLAGIICFADIFGKAYRETHRLTHRFIDDLERDVDTIARVVSRARIALQEELSAHLRIENIEELRRAVRLIPPEIRVEAAPAVPPVREVIVTTPITFESVTIEKAADVDYLIDEMSRRQAEELERLLRR